MSVRTAASARTAAPGRLNTDASGLPWEVFICRACGLLYDEAKGDEDSGLAAGTRFADIPEDWACPLCGVTKSDFEPCLNEEPVRPARRPATEGRQPTRSRHAAGTVIVGAGRAGWQMAQALRERDADVPITIVTACNGDVYDKPLLSVAMSRGIAVESLPRERGVDAARRLGVKLLAHTQAVRITAASRQLRTSRGTLRYQHLVLAHGAEARSLPQFPPSLCWRINHLQAYAKFRQGLGANPQRIAVVGAGLIGSELANDLALAGHTVTLLDLASRPLAASLTEAQSGQLLAAWRNLPLTFIGSVEVTDVRAVQEPSPTRAPTPGVAGSGGNAGTGGASAALRAAKQITTQCGQVITVDHIVLAAGLQTPRRLADSAGLPWDNGIDVAADTLATRVAGIHALGDCISINGQVSRYIEPIARQAQVLAATIHGQIAPPYRLSRVPLRIKTSSLPFTV